MRSIDDLNQHAALAWNCGLTCPVCKSRNDFTVLTQAEIRINAAQGWGSPDELQIEHDNPVSCMSCGHQASAESFNRNIAPVVMEIDSGWTIELDVASAGRTGAATAIVTTTDSTSLAIAKALDAIERNEITQGICLQASSCFELSWQCEDGSIACSSSNAWATVSPSGIRFSMIDPSTSSMLLTDELDLGELLFMSPCDSIQAETAS